MIRAASFVALAGCQLALGLDDFQHLPTHVSGEFRYVAHHQTDSGPTIELVDPAPDFATITARLPDGTPLAIEHASPALLAFERPANAPYVLTLQPAMAAFGSEYRSDSPTFSLRGYLWDRQDAVYATQPTMISVHATVENPAGCAPYVATLGMRTQIALPTSDPMNSMIDWHTVSVAEGKGPLLSAAKHDQLVFECVRDAGGYIRVAESQAFDLELADGQPTAVSATIAPPTFDRCVHLEMPLVTEMARVMTLTGATTSPDFEWGVDSIADPMAPPSVALSLAGRTTVTSDVSLDLPYHTPFAGETDLMAAGIQVGRNVAIGGAAPTFLNNQSTAYALIPPGSPAACGANVVTAFDPPIAMFTRGTLAGQPLATDGQPITIDRSTPVPFTFELTPGVSDDFPILLSELSVAAGNATTVQPIASYQAFTPEATIDPKLLVKNHTYVISVQVRRGFRDAAKLDYSTYTYPAGFTVVYGPTFTITN